MIKMLLFYVARYVKPDVATGREEYDEFVAGPFGSYEQAKAARDKHIAEGLSSETIEIVEQEILVK